VKGINTFKEIVKFLAVLLPIKSV